MAVSVAFSYCGGDEPFASAPSCTADAVECVDNEQLRRCVDGVWNVRHCNDECGALGASRSRGCNSLDGPDECACVFNRACEGDAALSCASSQHIVNCVNGEPQLALCQCSDEAQVSLGCQYLAEDTPSCACASLGEPCEPPRLDQCVGESSIARCESDIWTITPCTQICAPEQTSGACVFSTLSGAGECACLEP